MIFSLVVLLAVSLTGVSAVTDQFQFLKITKIERENEGKGTALASAWLKITVQMPPNSHSALLNQKLAISINILGRLSQDTRLLSFSKANSQPFSQRIDHSDSSTTEILETETTIVTIKCIVDKMWPSGKISGSQQVPLKSVSIEKKHFDLHDTVSSEMATPSSSSISHLENDQQEKTLRLKAENTSNTGRDTWILSLWIAEDSLLPKYAQKKSITNIDTSFLSLRIKKPGLVLSSLHGIYQEKVTSKDTVLFVEGIAQDAGQWEITHNDRILRKKGEIIDNQKKKPSPGFLPHVTLDYEVTTHRYVGVYCNFNAVLAVKGHKIYKTHVCATNTMANTWLEFDSKQKELEQLSINSNLNLTFGTTIDLFPSDVLHLEVPNPLARGRSH